jgi:hypothetical protein
MSPDTVFRKFARRGLGGVLAAGLTFGMVGMVAPAFAATTSSSGHMGMTMAASRVGTTPGWYDGHTVKFTYSKNFICKQPPASKASSGCEAGNDYEGVPASQFDPLYVMVPLGFTPPKSTLACPTPGHCVDHPSTIDLSAVFGSSSYNNVKLPAHSHIITTLNSKKPEWWNVVVIGVTNRSTWNEIAAAKSYAKVGILRRHGDKALTGNITTNLFLYFKAS